MGQGRVVDEANCASEEGGSGDEQQEEGEERKGGRRIDRQQCVQWLHVETASFTADQRDVVLPKQGSHGLMEVGRVGKLGCS